MNPVLPTWLILLFTMLALAAMLAGYKRARLRRKHLCLLLVLEGIMLASLLVAILQPTRHSRTPKPGAYRIVLLGDTSRSMSLRDMDKGISRRQALAEIEIIPHAIKTEYLVFAENMRSAQDFKGEDYMPGTTEPGEQLKSLLQESGRRLPIGGVLLFSDGATSAGEQLIDVAKEYGRQDIPITCIGLGGARKLQDLSVSWTHPSISIQRDSNHLLTADISGNFPAQVKLTLSESGNVIEERILDFSGKQEQIQFNVTPRTEGFHAYKLSISSATEEYRYDNNQAYCVVEATKPPVIRILSLLGGLDWEQRFINHFSSVNDQFSAASIVMLNEKHFYASGFPENIQPPKNSFPQETAFYDDFDIVILDTRAAPFLGVKGMEALLNFVERKGGGLVLRGPEEPLPEKLAGMLPAQLTTSVSIPAPTKLDFILETAFSNDRTGLLTQGTFLKKQEGLLVLEDLRKSARPLANLAELAGNASLPATVTMPYGAGRIVQTGLEGTWQWCLAGDKLHEAWWQGIFIWLSEAAKPRLRELNGHTATTGNDFMLNISVLDDQFLPAADAQVTADIRQPDGNTLSLPMEPSAEEEGHYSALFLPEMDGEYRISYKVQLPSRSLYHETFLVASSTGPEMENTAFNEALLRDVARITGGHYITLDTIDLSHIPISKNVPSIENITYLVSTWSMYAIFSVSAILLCFMRRKLGLK